MKKNKIWLGMLAMALVFGLAFVGCDSSSNNDDIVFIGGIGLTTSTPHSTVLAQFDLTSADFTAMNNAAGGGWHGWGTPEPGQLALFWVGRSEAQAAALVAAIEAQLSITLSGPSDNVLSPPGDTRTGTQREWQDHDFGVHIVYYLTDMIWHFNEGVFPQGTIEVAFW